MSRQVVVYISPWCSSSSDTQRALKEWAVPATFINIKEDRAAAARVKEWVGFESVPTVVIAEEGRLEPFEPPAPLAAGASPRGIDRGSMLTEANRQQLRAWLVKHGIMAE
ncbi:MAG: Glutaredoxin [Chloroflexi bacterium ADurb.Bin325]|nr:MAG: Glutaredoxin [Chloroflexi bacterium ADurb.Bin325]